MVRDFRNKNGLDKPKTQAKLTPGRKLKDEFKNEIELSEKVQGKLQELCQKGHNVNQILLELLEKQHRFYLPGL